jgi:hypothetical protein
MKSDVGKVKLNLAVTALSILMIASSGLNFAMNGDSVSFGIFIFLGLGLTTASVELKNPDDKIVKKRFNKYAIYFFTGAFVLFLYWLLAGYLRVI